MILYKIGSLLKSLVRRITNHFHTIFFGLNPIKLTTRQEFAPISRKHYLYPFSLFVLTFIDNFLVLFRSKYYRNIDKNDMLSRKMVPKELQEIGQIIIITAMVIPILVYGNLAFLAPQNQKYFMFVQLERKLVCNYNRQESRKLLNFYRKSNRIYQFLLISTACTVIPIQLLIFYFNWTGSFRDYLMIGYYPVYLIYMTFSKCFFLTDKQ